MESVRKCVDYRSGFRRGLRRSVPLLQTICFYVGDSKMTKMTVRCAGSAESVDIFRSFSFCNAWRRLAQFAAKISQTVEKAVKSESLACACGSVQAPLTLPLEVWLKNVCYFCLGPTTFWTNASNRGSPRSGSSQGSTLITLMLRPSWSAITCSNQRTASSRFPRLR